MLPLNLNLNPSEFDEYLNYGSQNLDSFGPISTCNIIIGANNSRKSRFLRKLLSFEDLVTSSSSISALQAELEELLKLIEKDTLIFNYIPKRDITSASLSSEAIPQELINLVKTEGSKNIEIRGRDIHVYPKTLDDYIGISKPFNETEFRRITFAWYSITEVIKGALNNRIKDNNGSIYTFRFADIREDHIPVLERFCDIVSELQSIKLEIFHPKDRIYIPSLRHVGSLFGENGRIESDIFKTTIESYYWSRSEANSRIKISTGLEFYSDVKQNLLNKREFRKRHYDFEKFLSNTFFSGRQLEIVPQEQSGEGNTILLYLEGEDDLPIHHYGDGIQNLIALLYPIFSAQKDSIICLEEPENSLHPGMQNIFIRTLISNSSLREKNLRFFISSHSNHFLNILTQSTNSVSIFGFHKEASGKTIVRSILKPNNIILKNLGVFNFSVFTSNCSIWVEGPTDRIIAQAYLLAYQSTIDSFFEEHFNYSFFLYGGDLIKYYLFGDNEEESAEFENDSIHALLLSNRIFLLADHDSGKLPKHQQLNKWSSQTTNDFKYSSTICREIENTIPSQWLSEFVGEINTRNIKVSKLLDYTLYSDEYLGKIIVENYSYAGLPNLVKENGKTMKTIYKNKMANFIRSKVLENPQDSWNIIKSNPFAADITTKIFNYIKSSNQT